MSHTKTDNYPLSHAWDYAPIFRTMKEAKQCAIEHGAKPVKVALGYQVKYKGTISNVCITGRAMSVINIKDGEIVLANEILTLIKSYPWDGTYKISCFDGIYVNRSNMSADIYVNTCCDGLPSVLDLIKELKQKGHQSYINHMAACRPSLHLFDNIVKSDWQKAKEQNYI